VLGGESAIKGQFSGDADASANAAAPDVLPRTIVRSDDVRSQGDSNRVANPSTLDAAPRDDATNAGLPSRQATVDAGDEIPSATSGRAVHRALDSAGIDAAATAIAEGSSARQRNDDSARPDDDEQNAEVRRDSTVDGDPAAVANEHVWAYDEPHGGMIALAVSYLPVDVEPSHPAADAWVVEDARPRGEGGYDEPRFESSVGLYQVLEVATATPPVRSVIAPQTGAAALMASPLSNADEEANELATPVHEQAEASVGVAGWINPNYAAATVSVLVLAAGVTLHSKRPHSVARRLVDRLRNRAESGK
jgi:hypothetical protein